MDDEQAKLAELRAERKRVRNEVYSLGMRLNAGEHEVRATLDAAIRRSDELAAEILRLSQPPRPTDDGPPLPAPMYGPPPSRERRLPRGGFDDSATMYGPPAPMYGPPSVLRRSFGFLFRLFGRK